MTARSLRLLLLTKNPKVFHATLDLLAAVEGERIQCAWVRSVDEIGPAREQDRCDVCLIDVELASSDLGIVDELRRRGTPLMVVYPPGGTARRRLRGFPCLEWTAAPETARGLLHRAAERRRRPRSTPSPARRFPHPELRDPLTGLPNAVLVEQLLAHALTAEGGLQPPSAGLVLLRVEEPRGAGPASDELLRLAARRLEAAVREGDDVGRIGSCEFAAILPGLGSEREVEAIAGRLAVALQRPASGTRRRSPIELRLAWSLLDGPPSAPEAAVTGLLREISDTGTPAGRRPDPRGARPPSHGSQAGS